MFTPHGRLTVTTADDGPLLEAACAERLQKAFARGSGHGLLQLGAGEVATPLPAVLSYWRDFAARYVTALCTLPDAEERGARVHVAPPAPEMLVALADAAPAMAGAEYLSGTALGALWQDLDAAFATELLEAGGTVQDFLRRHDPAWNLVGRVHFNLAENRKDEEAPFAFVATYTTRLSKQSKAQHLPLGRALQEYADASNQELLSLLLPVQGSLCFRCQKRRLNPARRASIGAARESRVFVSACRTSDFCSSPNRPKMAYLRGRFQSLALVFAAVIGVIVLSV